MSFTYNIVELSSSSLFQVRLAIGDVVNQTADNESLHDEEISHVLTLTSDVDLAAVRCCDLLIARLRHKIGSSAGGQSSNQREKIDGLLELRKVLEERVSKGAITAYFGGLSQSRIDDARSDTDYPQPAFRVGRDDYPGVGVDTGDDDS